MHRSGSVLIEVKTVGSVGEESVSLYPSRFLGWSQNQIGIRHINRSKTSLIVCVWEPPEDMRTSKAARSLCKAPSRGGVGSEDTKRKQGRPAMQV